MMLANTGNDSNNDGGNDAANNCEGNADDESSLPSHMLHMRSAFRDCHRGIEKLRRLSKPQGGGNNASSKAAYKSDNFYFDNDSNGLRMPKNQQQQKEKYCTHQIFHSAWLASKRYQDQREDGLRDVHDRIFNARNASTCSRHSSNTIDTVYTQTDGSSWCKVDSAIHSTNPFKIIDGSGDACPQRTVKYNMIQEGENSKSNTTTNPSYHFKQQYCVRNVHCIIRGLDHSHFSRISSEW